MKRKIFITILLLIWCALLPDYKIIGSNKFSCNNYTESTLSVQVYKSLHCWEKIEKEHIRVNGTPNKLVIYLYLGGWKYKTVVYDYDRRICYMNSGTKISPLWVDITSLFSCLYPSSFYTICTPFSKKITFSYLFWGRK